MKPRDGKVLLMLKPDSTRFVVHLLYDITLKTIAHLGIGTGNLVAFLIELKRVKTKLDGVGPIDNRPSPDKLQHFV